MQKKLTITVEESIYNGLYAVVGKRKISRFIESLVRSHILAEDLDPLRLSAGYRAMALDTDREREALAWTEGTIGDVANETR